jgi:DNA-binding transcriptional LysR family regulator
MDPAFRAQYDCRVEWSPYVAGAPELDLRRLRYFVAVAQELHFGKAAKRLYITQPVLTRQVRQLEQELGVILFTRTTRDVQLTPAGEQLLSEARPLLAAVDAAKRRVRRTGAGEAALTVGFFVGDPVGQAVRAFTRDHDDVVVDLMRIYWSDQTEVLLNGRVDVAFVHLPVERAGLELVPAYTASRVALLPRGHALADRDRASLTELTDEPMILHDGAWPEWEAFHNVDPRPDASHPVAGPTVRNIEEKLEHIAAGRAISFVPWTAATAIALQPDVVAVPVDDLLPVQVCLAWNSEAASPNVFTFVDAARDALSHASR